MLTAFITGMLEGLIESLLNILFLIVLFGGAYIIHEAIPLKAPKEKWEEFINDEI